MTQYAPLIDSTFAYVGIASIVAGIGLNVYGTRDTRRPKPIDQNRCL